MAQLIQMRQRIKAIKTIKKVTHAMQLISMSSHTRLQGKRANLNHYRHEVAKLLNQVQSIALSNKNYTDNTKTISVQTPLIILIGSQKGLCGNFNNMLFARFELFLKENVQDTFEMIVVGKQATESLQTKYSYYIINTYDHLTSHALHTLADAITKNIRYFKEHAYRPVWVVSNALKTFFSQKPVITQLLPLPEQKDKRGKEAIEPFILEQPLERIVDYLEYEYLYNTIYYTLFESLTAEQAARFVSMDNATRNARTLLEVTRHEYNKLRQAKITSELAELTSNI